MKNNLCLRAVTGTCFLLAFLMISKAQTGPWQSRGPGGGGSLFYPSINPANDNEFYIACDMSQLFHSTDFGNSYSQVPFTKLQVGNHSTYEFTNNNNIAWCIANDGNINYAARTLDGGNTWNALPGNPLNGEDVYALKADYANPGRIVMGYYGSLYITNDTGKTFSIIRTAANAGAGLTLAGILFDGNAIYIGTNEGLLYSANGGASFVKLVTTGMPATETIFSFAGAKSGAVTRFFCITANSADVYNGIFPWEYWGLAKGVYSMDAGTNTWISKMSGINISSDFIMYVGMAGNDIATVYLGGSDGATGGNLVMKTVNAGDAWTKVFLTNNNQNIRTGWSGHGGDRGWGYGESCFGITVAPGNSNKVLFGDFGFVHKTSDGGASWRQAYVDPSEEHPAAAPTPPKQYYHSVGLENTTCWQVHWQDPNNMFACYSDINGIRSKDGGLSWGFDYTGHNVNSMYRIAKQAGGNTMFAATSGVHDMYQSTRLQDNLLDANDPGGKIIYSVTNGANWQLLHQFDHPVFWVATDPNNANRMYASVIHYGGGTGQGGIWVTNDVNNLGASTWTKLDNPPRTQGHPAAILVLNDGKMVCTYSGRRTPGGTFTASSGVFLYDPVTNSWADRSHADMQYWTKDIVADPADPAQNTWYACVFSGWGGAPNDKGGLFKTVNRGLSWVKLTGSQFDRVTSITFNPVQTSQAWLTTEIQGLWISNNMNAATPAWMQVSNYHFRQPERVFFNPFNPNEVWVSSFGNGMKSGLLSSILPARLISFTGSREQLQTMLRWTTASQDPGDAFEILRSTDGSHFEKIATVPANTGDNHYRYTDRMDARELYYRLKINRLSGENIYSNIIVFKTNSRRNDIQVIGNPVTDHITLAIQVEKAGKLELIFNSLPGKKIMQQQSVLSAGIHQMDIPIPADCANGIYILQVQHELVKKNIRIVVVK